MPAFRGKLTIDERVVDVDGQCDLQDGQTKQLTGSFTLPVKDASAAILCDQCRLDIDGGMSINIMVPRFHATSSSATVTVPFFSKGKLLDINK
jgi:hypothetical protein